MLNNIILNVYGGEFVADHLIKPVDNVFEHFNSLNFVKVVEN